ncbi:MAG: 7-methyl-GTP pyrophosphatase [Candidatus Celerinatantimonas neptuna]|nr:MAG: 7-methyl-GTP pyrophosphatase [Candidatus Celerinatantimonas neptuna]
MGQEIILASSSPYRRQLLSKLGIRFNYDSPNIDETPYPDESAEHLVTRLSIAKAKALAAKYTDHIIIGSDQVCTVNEVIMGKPGNHFTACHQLQMLSGQRVKFLTGLAVLNTSNHKLQHCVEPFEVVFRVLSPQLIERYVKADQPFDCAGSFKSEGKGIVLFKSMRGEDPNSLIGLPLIRLTRFLDMEGIKLLTH